MTASITTDTTENPTLLTDQMRAATKDIHDKSDRLVNLKLALVLTSPALYGEAIGLFLPVFEKIEEIMDQHKNHPKLGELSSLIDTLRRGPAFRADMAYYLTTDRRKELEESWQKGEHPEVTAYLKHIETIEREDPIRVLAYYYHLNGAILAGGQIIKRTVSKALGLPKDQVEGVQVFDVKDNISISSKGIFNRVKKIYNEELELTAKEKEALIEEGVEVFRLNNQLVGSVKGTEAWKLASDSFMKKILLGCSLSCAAMMLAWKLFFR